MTDDNISVVSLVFLFHSVSVLAATGSVHVYSMILWRSPNTFTNYVYRTRSTTVGIHWHNICDFYCIYCWNINKVYQEFLKK